MIPHSISKCSAARRARDIHGIYDLAVPVPGTVNTAPAIEFMRSVHELILAAVEENGEELRP